MKTFAGLNPNDWRRSEIVAGKIRQIIDLPQHHKALVVSDKISAFDCVFGLVPCKGRVLNQLAVWWFGQLDKTIPHHLISSPHPYLSVVKSAQVFAFEVIIRGYLTGTTATSSWHAYQHNNREICGQTMPPNMTKNQQFSSPIITPTTKPAAGSGLHDEAISVDQILERQLATPKQWEEIEDYTRRTFALGQKIAAERGLILVDTKYEFGVDVEGNIMLVDEVHTTDSSRYWQAESYHQRWDAGQEPDNLDKEFFRRELVDAGFDPTTPPAEVDTAQWFNEELAQNTSRHYQDLYQQITGTKLDTTPAADLVTTLNEVWENLK